MVRLRDAALFFLGVYIAGQIYIQPMFDGTTDQPFHIGLHAITVVIALLFRKKWGLWKYAKGALVVMVFFALIVYRFQVFPLMTFVF